MTDMNSVVLIGRVTRDLDERSFAYTQGGTARLSFSIAVNRSVKGANGEWTDEASFFDVTVWGKRAESLKQYMAKGLRVAVGGSLRQDRWTDQQGNSRSRVSVVADDVQILTPKQQGGLNPGAPYPTAQAAQQADAQPYGAQGQYQRPPAQDGAFKEDLPWEDDIPF